MAVRGGDAVILEWIICTARRRSVGALASMGLGGGFVLLVYLILSDNSDQLSSQEQNLIFFLPVIAVSLIFHIKNKLIDWKAALICGLIGAAAVYPGYLLAKHLESGV